jgi:DNA-binding IclR family transcriptional regulator
MERPSYSVVDRTIDIFECFFGEMEPTLTSVSRAVGLDAATTSRYLASLVQRGWVERDADTKRFRLGPRAVALGNAATRARPVRQLAQVQMTRLARLYDETVNLAMRTGNDLLIIDAVESQRSIKRGAQIGQRDIWHTSSVGKAILAHLPDHEINEIVSANPLSAPTPRATASRAHLDAVLAEVRTRGYAVDLEEGELGLRCVGVPLLDTSGAPLFAMSISGPADRMTDALVSEMARELLAVAEDVSHADILPSANRAIFRMTGPTEA